MLILNFMKPPVSIVRDTGAPNDEADTSLSHATGNRHGTWEPDNAWFMRVRLETLQSGAESISGADSFYFLLDLEFSQSFSGMELRPIFPASWFFFYPC